MRRAKIEYSEAKPEKTPQKRKLKIEENMSTCQCPLCKNDFLEDEIQLHASTCGVVFATLPTLPTLLELTEIQVESKVALSPLNSRFEKEEKGSGIETISKDSGQESIIIAKEDDKVNVDSVLKSNAKLTKSRQSRKKLTVEQGPTL